jgi:Ca2+-transporting ATPase
MIPETPAGLDPATAAQRLRDEGPNELGVSQRRTLQGMAWEVVREPMFLLLLGAGAVYLAMGDAHEALILLGFVIIIMTITVLQERRTDNALEALRDLSSPRALVLRGGQTLRIAGRDVVRGDVLLLPRATVCLPTANCCRRTSWPPTNPCSRASLKRWPSNCRGSACLPARW